MCESRGLCLTVVKSVDKLILEHPHPSLIKMKELTKKNKKKTKSACVSVLEDRDSASAGY